MNTKFSFALLVSVIALVATACAPAIAGNISPKDPAQPAVQENSALIPVTGASVSVPARDSQELRLWSGAISLSDTDNPDYVQNNSAPAIQNEQNECISEDSLLKRQSGCIE